MQVLPVARLPTVSLAALVLEDPDLGPTHLVDQRRLDPGAGDHRIADAGPAVPEDHQNAVEGDLGALLRGDREQLDVEDVSCLDPILLTAGLDHCEHDDTPF